MPAPSTPSRGFQTRRGNTSGHISWHKDRIFIIQEEDIFRVYFRDMELGDWMWRSFDSDR